MLQEKNPEMTENELITPAPKRVLAIQAHPDDIEFGQAGTIAKWAREGAEIVYCSVTSGDKGSADPEMTGEKLSATREEEQRKACEILGVKDVIFLRYKDATLVADLDLRLALTRVMRQVKPDVVLSFDPTARILQNSYINHPDHIATGEATLAAVFPSVRDRMTFPELLAEGLEPHKVPHVYLYASDQPNTWIDVTDTMDLRLEALKAHASQLGDQDPTEWIREWARETAKTNPNRESATEYMEAFRYIRLD
jgi:LmbE family N-acetylglucosaminyl deacetylase